MAKKILIVDDSPTDSEALSLIIKAAGYETISAYDGDSGVEKAKTEQPALVIMDIVMPGKNGFQATKEISKGESTKHIPVVICSNKHQDTDKLWGEKNGAKFYFVKPAQPLALIQKIKELAGEPN